MARNEQHRHADHIALPVPTGTKAGDPVRVGILNGVAQTNRATSTEWGGGNVEGNASVWLDGSHHFPVKGAATIGQAVYIDASNVLSTTKGSGAKLYGAALASQTADGTIPVKIIQAEA